MVSFESDYITGAHPQIMKRLSETNLECLPGYGMDKYCESAKEKIRIACGCEKADVEFLVGGTQTNAVVIDRLLDHNDGVVAADTGHINVHEAGAIESNGHKVLTLRGCEGKLLAVDVSYFIREFYLDSTNEYMVRPGMVYVSVS